MSEKKEITSKSDVSFPGLDALRGYAALGVVLLHCCVPYMNPKVPGLAWSVEDSPHWAASLIFWSIELFIMPVFLLLAGYFAWGSLVRSGSKRLVTSRARRLLVPLGFGMVVILPIDLYVWLAGWVADGKIPLRKLKSLKFADGIDQDLWGLSHLWFLQYVFLYVLILAGAYFLYRRIEILARYRLSATLCVVMLSAMGCLTLFIHPEVVWGFQHRFYPVLSKWLYSGLFFAGGALVAFYDPRLTWIAAKVYRSSGLALAFSISALLLGQWHLRGGDHQFATMMLAVTTCAAAALITVSFVGLAAKVRGRLRWQLQYLAAASFWIYLIHHPILGLLQVDLKWLLPNTSSLLKIGLVFAASLSLSLVSYEAFIRRTLLGRILGFQWQENRSLVNLQTMQPNEAEEPQIFALPSSLTPESQKNHNGAAHPSQNDCSKAKGPVRRVA